MPRIAGTRSSSIELSEIVINTGEAAWTQVDAGCAVDVDSAKVKRGTDSAKFTIGAAAAQGLQAWAASAAADLDLRAWPTAWGFTHIKYWIYSSVATAAGDLKIGMGNDADPTAGGTTEYYVNVPALAATTMTLVRTPLSSNTDIATNLSSVSNVCLWLQTAAWEGVLYIDDIRICRYETRGDSAITIPETQTYGNTLLDKRHVELFYLPWRSAALTVYELPVDAEILPFMGSNVGTWTSSDLAQGCKRLYSGQTAEELGCCATSIAVRTVDDLADPASYTDSDTWTAEFISLEVSE